MPTRVPRELGYDAVARLMALVCVKVDYRAAISDGERAMLAQHWAREARCALNDFIDSGRASGLSFRQTIVACVDAWQHKRVALQSDFPLQGPQ